MRKAFQIDEGYQCRLGCGERWNELHHVVPRSQSGDDWYDNLVPLCADCHRKVTDNRLECLMLLRWALKPAQTRYCIERKGEGWLDKKYPKVMAL